MHLSDAAKRAKLRALFTAWLNRLRYRILGDPETPVEATVVDLVGTAYAFGSLSAEAPAKGPLGKTPLATLEAPLKAKLATLSPVEQAAVAAAKAHAGAFLTKLGGSVEADVMTSIAQADVQVRAEVKKGVSENLARRGTLSQLATKLGQGKEGWTRDWRRVARTETQEAMSQGAADAVEEAHGPEAYVYKLCAPSACPRCVALYVGPVGEPRIFKLSQLQANGSNAGRKAADWLATVGPIHVHCACSGPHPIPAGWILSGGIAYPNAAIAAKMKKSAGALSSTGGAASLFPDWGNRGSKSPGTSGAQIDISPKPFAIPDGQPRLMVRNPQTPAYEGLADAKKLEPEKPAKKRTRWEPLAGVDLALRTRLLVQPSRLENISVLYKGSKALVAAIQDAEDAPFYMTPEQLAKAGPGGMEATNHKYTHREWAADHWIYDYAKKYGGKVEGHHADLDKIVLKTADPQKIHELKKIHNLAGEPWQGPKYAAIEIHKDELAKMGGSKKPLPLPTPAKLVKEQLDKLGPGADAPSHEPAKAKGRVGEYKVLASTDLKIPTGIKPGHLQRGQPVLATLHDGTSIQGTLAGVDFKGRSLVDANGKTRTVDLSPAAKKKGAKLEPHGAKAPYAPAHTGVSAGNVVATTERQKKLFAKIMDTPIVGKHVPREFTDWLTSHGYEVYVIGGVPRDIAAGTAAKDLSDAEILASANDVDIVTTATAKDVSQMLKEIAPEAHASGFQGTNEQSMWHAKIGSGDGLDIVSMIAAAPPGQPSFFPTAKGVDAPLDPDTKEAKWNLRFDHSLLGDTVRRDFAANSVYYDPLNDALVDPTGHGIEDAERKQLHFSGNDLENSRNTSLPARFWKFRARGYTADAETLQKQRKLAEVFFQQPAYKYMDALSWQAGKLSKSEFHKRLKAAMIADGHGDLHKKYIEPQL